MGKRKRALSLQAVKLLAVMLQDPTREYWGSDLGQRIGAASGTIYPLLDGLEAKGLLDSRREEVNPAEVKRPRRRLYRLTGEGEVVARHEVAQLQSTLNQIQPALGWT